MKKKAKSNFTTYLLIFIFIIGLSLLLYPKVSNYWNSFHQSRAIASYVETLSQIDEETYQEIMRLAEAYNNSLLKKPNPFALNDQENVIYHAMLDINGDGIMGYIEIPSINVTLPIYHGTDEAVLQVAAGHLEWTSLPIGGESTHCVVSGHRGLPSAELFTNLDKLTVGDTFLLNVLNETLTYEVDQILIVDPSDVSNLAIEEGKDLCTLITCTPYGVNSHRMLVRGHRVENAEEATTLRVVSDAMQVDTILVAPFFAILILLLLLIPLLFGKRGKREKRPEGMSAYERAFGKVPYYRNPDYQSTYHKTATETPAETPAEDGNRGKRKKREKKEKSGKREDTDKDEGHAQSAEALPPKS